MLASLHFQQLPRLHSLAPRQRVSTGSSRDDVIDPFSSPVQLGVQLPSWRLAWGCIRPISGIFLSCSYRTWPRWLGRSLSLIRKVESIQVHLPLANALHSVKLGAIFSAIDAIGAAQRHPTVPVQPSQGTHRCSAGSAHQGPTSHTSTSRGRARKHA